MDGWMGHCSQAAHGNFTNNYNKLCAWRHNMPRPSPPPCRGRPSASRAAEQTQRGSILSHAEYVPTLTAAAALRVKAALSKAAW